MFSPYNSNLRIKKKNFYYTIVLIVGGYLKKWYNVAMLETKIIISYIVVCVAYSLCRLHYLMTVKSDEEFNSMLNQLIDLAGSRDIVKVLILLQLVLSPITAPFSMLKQLFKLLFPKNDKE